MRVFCLEIVSARRASLREYLFHDGDLAFEQVNLDELFLNTFNSVFLPGCLMSALSDNGE